MRDWTTLNVSTPVLNYQINKDSRLTTGDAVCNIECGDLHDSFAEIMQRIDFLEDKIENLEISNAELIHEVEQLKVKSTANQNSVLYLYI